MADEYRDLIWLERFAGLQIQRSTARNRAESESESESESTEQITSSQNSFGLLAGQQPSGHRIQQEGLIHQSCWLQSF